MGNIPKISQIIEIKALGNYVSNLAHTYFLIIFAKIVNLWTIVIVSAESWVKGHHPMNLLPIRQICFIV